MSEATRGAELGALLDARLDAGAMRGQRVLIAAPDATRPLDVPATIAPLLTRLLDAGARPRVMIALGLHRPMTERELAPLAALLASLGVPLIQHDASHPGTITLRDDVGLLEGHVGTLPAAFHPKVVEADHLIALGLVEPHQYAGFSGGVKTLAIGCASAATISAMHGLTLLRAPGTRLGQLEGNPFQAALRRSAATLPTIDALQLVPGPAHTWAAMTYGPAIEAQREAVALAGASMFEAHPTQYPWVHLPVEEAKAASFYQASRAASYVALVARPIIETGGWLLIEAPCREGFGLGAGERAAEALARQGIHALLTQLRDPHASSPAGGAQRAHVMALVSEVARVALIGAPPIEALRALEIPQFATLTDAQHTLGLDPGAGVSLPDVFHRVPTLAMR